MVRATLTLALVLATAVVPGTGSALGAATPAEPARPTILRGVLDVVQQDDFASGHTQRSARLVEEASGRVFEIRLADDARLGPARTGSRVVVRGLARGHTVFVGTGPDSGVDLVAAESAAAAVTGTRHAVVLVVDFADSAVSCADSQIESLMFTGAQSVNALYQSSSFGQLALPADTDNDGQPDVFRVTIPQSIAGNCDPYGWAAQAEAEAPNAGVDLGLYQHRVFVLPSDVSCGWAGLGNVGCGSFCRAWIKTCHLGDVYAHEVGHNLQLAHASTDTNNDGVVDCEYCDQSDPMGYGGVGWRIFNGAHEHRMGWLPPGQIVDVAGSGTQNHVLSPLQMDPALAPYPQVLRIAKPDSGDYYYLSYRQRSGFDASLNMAYVDRTSVHRYAGSGYNNTLFLQALRDGEIFEDLANGFTVTQLSHDAASATLQISTECSAAAPTVAVSPASQPGSPGSALVYTASLTNNDPALCDASTFDLAAGAPASWTVALSANSLTLAPGSQGQITLTATSDGAAADGAYTVQVDASDALETLHQASDAGTYVVDGTPPDPVGDLSAEIKRKTQVQLSWSAAYDAGSGVAEYIVYRDGAALDTTTSPGYLDRSTTSGATHDYHVRVVDALGHESADSNHAVISVGGGGGGGKGGGGKGGPSKETCDDGIDNDGDGLVDCDDADCGRAKVCR